MQSLARRAQRTGFDTWGDAEEALAVGMAMHDIVTKEFERTYPEGEIVNVTMAVEDHHLRRLVDRYNACAPSLVLHSIDRSTSLEIQTFLRV